MRGKCIHPRKMVRYMKEFLEQANDITFNCSYLKPAPVGVDKYEWFCNQDNWIEEELLCSVRITKNKRDNFCANLGEFFNEDESILHVSYENSLLKGPYCRNVFTRNFHRRAPFTRGFAGVTISLLHELGHFETDEKAKEQYPNFDRRMALLEAHLKSKTTEELNEKYYFNFPDERMATEWAIEWLKDAEHRKIAKAFEKNFFECFEKSLDKQ